MTASRTPGKSTPFRFFSLNSLEAGLFLTWRLWLWILMGQLCAFIIVRILVMNRVLPAPLEYFAIHATVELGVAIGVTPWLWRLNNIANSWARARYGCKLTRPVRWGIVWRGGLVTLGSFISLGVLATGAEWVFGTPLESLPKVTGVMLLVALALISTLGLGWAMSVMVSNCLVQSKSS